DEVPAVSVKVEENGDRAVRLLPRLLREPHTAALHVAVVPPEVVRPEEQEHPPAGLVADPCRLLRVVRPRQKQGRAAAGRADQAPPLAAPERRILRDREPQAAGEVGDGLVVVPDDEGNGRDLLPHCLSPPSLNCCSASNRGPDRDSNEPATRNASPVSSL